MQHAESFEQRRYDLDWVRICAFLLLILYHVGTYYVTWDFHVKSPLRPMFHGDYELVVRDGSTLPLSRRYKALLPAAIRDRL